MTKECKCGPSFIELDCAFLDKPDIKAIGSFKPKKGKWVVAKFDLKELIGILKAYQELNKNFESFDSVDVGWATEGPVVIGSFNPKNKRMNGITLAPRTED